MSLCNSPGSAPNMSYRLENGVDIFRQRARIESYTHHRAAVQTNLAFDIYLT